MTSFDRVNLRTFSSNNFKHHERKSYRSGKIKPSKYIRTNTIATDSVGTRLFYMRK